MEDRDLIEIALDDRDAKLLPSLYDYFKSFWSDTSQEPRAHYNKFIANTPIADGVVFRPAAASEPTGGWCEPRSADGKSAMLYLHGGAYVMGNAEAYAPRHLSADCDCRRLGRRGPDARNARESAR